MKHIGGESTSGERTNKKAIAPLARFIRHDLNYPVLSG